MNPEPTAKSQAAGRNGATPFRFYDNRQKYLAFVNTCNNARDAATNLLACQSKQDPELLLLSVAVGEPYGNTATAIHILRTDFGSTPATFIEDLKQANAAIQADVSASSVKVLRDWMRRAVIPADDRVSRAVFERVMGSSRLSAGSRLS